LELHGMNIAPFQELSQFTIYAVQFRYDATAEPLGLNRPPFQTTVHDLLSSVETVIQQSPH
jgi:hypothetical protein